MVLLEIASLGQKLTETQYFLVVTPYCASVIHNGLVYEFLRVLKKLKFLLKSIGLSLGFSEHRQFGAKTDTDSLFLVRNPHIADRIYITVSYLSFYRFWKNSNFHSKSVGVSLRFYGKSPFRGKNCPKLSISWSLSSYCGLIIHNSLVCEFLQVFKKLKFSLKIRRG
jgi:hypothetical protein